jgi:hypothetical protein
MPDQWYYKHDAEKLGPFSSAQLLELATAGKIQPTDTVFKAGIDTGVPAAKVKRLFPATQADTAPVAKVDTPPPPPAPVPVAPPPPEEAPAAAPHSPLRGRSEPLSKDPAPPTSSTGMPKVQTRKGRATAGQGAIIVSQDGTTVQYIKKCIKCGHADASKSRMPIKHGTTRIGYYCPKCRKLRPVEIQGIL